MSVYLHHYGSDTGVVLSIHRLKMRKTITGDSGEIEVGLKTSESH